MHTRVVYSFCVYKRKQTLQSSIQFHVFENKSDEKKMVQKISGIFEFAWRMKSKVHWPKGNRSVGLLVLVLRAESTRFNKK